MNCCVPSLKRHLGTSTHARGAGNMNGIQVPANGFNWDAAVVAAAATLKDYALESVYMISAPRRAVVAKSNEDPGVRIPVSVSPQDFERFINDKGLHS